MFARKLTVTRSHTVFQALPAVSKVTYDDVRDALEATRKCKPTDARDYFLSNGIDYDNVVKYWETVQKLEKSLYIKKN